MELEQYVDLCVHGWEKIALSVIWLGAFMQKTPVVTRPASVDKEKGKGDYKSPPKKRRERSHSKHRSRSHSR